MDRQLTLLKQARHAQGWSQEQAIVRIEARGRAMGIALPTRSSLRTLLSAFENGHRSVPEQYRPIFRELYRATDADLGFQQAGNVLTLPVLPGVPVAGAERPTPEIITYLSNVRAEHAKADALLGPRYLIPTVQSQMPLIERLCQGARGPEREAILTVAARYAEFCGWLYQDTGHEDSAIYWTNQALDYAHELDDARLIAYILHRKSNIVTEAGSPGHGLGLANAALKAAKSLPPRILAVTLRQQARAHALLSEQSEFRQVIDQALQSASEKECEDLDNPALYCTPSYVIMEAGISWVGLGKPEVAANVFYDSLRTWPENTQTRDRGLCLARLATALAMQDDVDEACEAALEASTVAQSTGSARIRSQLETVYNRLKPLTAANPMIQKLERQFADST
jgi:transcriptional regulator with XRE-family HTH domain